MAIINRPINRPDERYRVTTQQTVKDVRPLLTKFSDAVFEDKVPIIVFIAVATIVGVVFPVIDVPLLIILLTVMGIVYPIISRPKLPMRLPVFAKCYDYNDPIPGSRKPAKASGVILIGNEANTNKELWVSVRDATTHTMVFGSTGAGKTELLMGLGTTSLIMGSGFSITDPKGSQKVAIQVYSLCRYFFREHDFRLLNYSSVTSGWAGRTHRKETNTTNPFFRGTDVDAANTLTSLITVSKGDNAVFGAQAQNFMTALLRGLVEMRDRHRRPLDVRTIRDHTPSSKFIELAYSDMLSENTKDSMKSFLSSVGYSPNQDPSKQNSFNQQYGYALAYFSQPLNSLTDSYGYIYGATRGEVDRIDCIRERRILVEIIPSMKKSPAEVSNIGKISLSSTKMAVGAGLGDKLEGVGKEVLGSTPMSGRESSPYMVIVDEMAAIATEGFVTVLTQGRSIGVAAIIASQDADGLKKASEGEYNQAIENTKIKMFGTMDLAGGTFELLQKAAGKITVQESQGAELRTDSLISGYMDTGRSGVKEMDRVQVRDLQKQIEGEFHMVFRGEVITGKGFYANPQIKDIKMRLNRFITNPNVYEEDVAEFKKSVGTAIADLTNPPKNGYRAPQSNMSNILAKLGSIVSDAFMESTGLGVRELTAGAFEVWKDYCDEKEVTIGGKGDEGEPMIPESMDELESVAADTMVTHKRKKQKGPSFGQLKDALDDELRKAIESLKDNEVNIVPEELESIVHTISGDEEYEPADSPETLDDNKRVSLQDKLRNRLKKRNMGTTQ